MRSADKLCNLKKEIKMDKINNKMDDKEIKRFNDQMTDNLKSIHELSEGMIDIVSDETDPEVTREMIDKINKMVADNEL